MPISLLDDRGVVSVSGADAKGFLDGLLTCDMDRIAPGKPRFGALLTPQGKILFDFHVHETPDGGYRLDVLKPFAPDLAKRLGFYKLRAKVLVDDVSDRFAVLAGWDGAARPDGPDALVADDPRLPALGWRAIVPSTTPSSSAGAERRAEEPTPERPGPPDAANAPGVLGSPPEFTPDPDPGAPAEDDGPGKVPSVTYHALRIVLGVPEGGRDFLFGDAFPHEALMDQLGGIDFHKGCYVGQEVVSRMHHRGTVRTRLVPLVYLDGFVTEPGVEVTAGERALGKAGTGANGRGLAMLRLDRVADALAAGETIRAGGLPVRLEKPDWIAFPFPDEVRTTAA